jgi:hypothetical protein
VRRLFNRNFRGVNHFQTHKRSPEIFPTGASFDPSIVRRRPVGHQIMRRFFPKFSNPIIFIFPPKILLTKCPYNHFSKSCDCMPPPVTNSPTVTPASGSLASSLCDGSFQSSLRIIQISSYISLGLSILMVIGVLVHLLLLIP